MFNGRQKWFIAFRKCMVDSGMANNGRYLTACWRFFIGRACAHHPNLLTHRLALVEITNNSTIRWAGASNIQPMLTVINWAGSPFMLSDFNIRADSPSSNHQTAAYLNYIWLMNQSLWFANGINRSLWFANGIVNQHQNRMADVGQPWSWELT